MALCTYMYVWPCARMALCTYMYVWTCVRICTYGLTYVHVPCIYAKRLAKRRPVLPQLFHHSLYLGIQMYYVIALRHEYYLVHQSLHTKSVDDQPVTCSSLSTVFYNCNSFSSWYSRKHETHPTLQYTS